MKLFYALLLLLGCTTQTIILPDGTIVVCQVCPGSTICF